MTEAFACPECGDEVTLLGVTPGRHVQCAGCSTWVEVPYLPRDGVWTRPKFRKARPSWVIPLAWAGVGLLAVVVAMVAGGKYAESRGRSARETTLAELLRDADAAEKAGRAGRALSEVEAALSLLRASEQVGSARVATLVRRRDALSIREAEARLAGATRLDPPAAVGDLLSLQARARNDRALDSLTSTILDAVHAARRRQVDADLDSARRARDEGRPFDVLTMGERALVVAEKLNADVGRAVAADVEALLSPIVERLGVIVAQRPGAYTLGSIDAYDATLGASLAEALRRVGYAPRPPRGPARPLWDRHAPFRLNFEIAETQDSLYLQSRSRLSEISARLVLVRGRGESIWQTRVTARTQVPLPDLPAYVGSRLAVADHRDPETERRLYENARNQLLDQINGNARGIPAP